MFAVRDFPNDGSSFIGANVMPFQGWIPLGFTTFEGEIRHPDSSIRIKFQND